MTQHRRRKRDTYKYVLRDGRDIVQYGVSDDPEVRVNQHSGDNKRFTSMTIVGAAAARESGACQRL